MLSWRSACLFAADTDLGPVALTWWISAIPTESELQEGILLPPPGTEEVTGQDVLNTWNKDEMHIWIVLCSLQSTLVQSITCDLHNFTLKATSAPLSTEDRTVFFDLVLFYSPVVFLKRYFIIPTLIFIISVLIFFEFAQLLFSLLLKLKLSSLTY